MWVLYQLLWQSQLFLWFRHAHHGQVLEPISFFSSEKDHPSYINSNKTLQVIQQRCWNPGGGWRVHEIQNGKFVPVATGQIRTRRSEPDKLHTPSLSLSESLENRCQTDRSHKPKPGFGIRPSKMKEREGNLHTPSLIHGGRRGERKAGEEGGWERRRRNRLEEGKKWWRGRKGEPLPTKHTLFRTLSDSPNLFFYRN